MDDEPGRRHPGAALHGDVVQVRHPSSIVQSYMSALRKAKAEWVEKSTRPIRTVKEKDPQPIVQVPGTVGADGRSPANFPTLQSEFNIGRRSAICSHSARNLDLASLPCLSNSWLWIGAPQLSQVRFKDSRSAGVSSWTTAEWNPVKVHTLQDTSQQWSKKCWVSLLR